MRINAGAIGSGCLGVLVVIILAVADSRTFEDAEYSPLYQATLKNAYSRFKESDKRVRAGVAAEPAIDPALEIDALEALHPAPRGTGSAARGGNRGTPGSTPPFPINGPRQHGEQRPVGPGRQTGTSPPSAHQHGEHMKAGERLAQQSEYDKAIGEFRLELAEFPQCALAQHRIADMLRLGAKPEDAVAAYEEVLRISPSYHCAHTHIAEIRASQGKADLANAAYDRAIEGYREQIKAGGSGAASARYHLAKLLTDRNRDLTEAIALAEQVVAESPDKPTHLHLLARCYEAGGRVQDAVAALDKAIGLDPEHGEIYRAYRDRLAKSASKPARDGL